MPATTPDTWKQALAATSPADARPLRAIPWESATGIATPARRQRAPAPDFTPCACADGGLDEFAAPRCAPWMPARPRARRHPPDRAPGPAGWLERADQALRRGSRPQADRSSPCLRRPHRHPRPESPARRTARPTTQSETGLSSSTTRSRPARSCCNGLTPSTDGNMSTNSSAQPGDLRLPHPERHQLPAAAKASSTTSASGSNLRDQRARRRDGATPTGRDVGTFHGGHARRHHRPRARLHLQLGARSVAALAPSA